MTIFLHGGKVEIISEDVPFQLKWFKIVLRRERHIKFDGTWSEPRTSVIFERNDSVAILIHDKKMDKIALVEQYRPAVVYEHFGLFEIPAGSTELGESIWNCVRREAKEEVGMKVGDIRMLYQFYVSPGADREKIYLFYAPVDSGDRVSDGGGLEEEGEDIQIFWVDRDEVLKMLADGRIIDAKSIIALQWFVNQH